MLPLIYKEIRTCHSHPHTKTYLKQWKSMTFHITIRDLRSQGKISSKTRETSKYRESQW